MNVLGFARPAPGLLLIEDSKRDRNAFASAVGGLYRLEHAETLAKGLDTLRTAGGISLVVADLGLPDSRGVETVQTLRRCARWAPVLVWTGNADPSLASECIQAGALEVVTKQAPASELLYRIAVAFARAAPVSPSLAWMELEDAVRGLG